MKPSWALGSLTVVIVFLESLLGYPAWLRDTIRWLELAEAVAVLAIVASIADRLRRLPPPLVFLSIGVTGLVIASTAAVLSTIGREFIWYVTPFIFPSVTFLLIGLIHSTAWIPNGELQPDRRRRTLGKGYLLWGLTSLFVVFALWVAEHNGCRRTNFISEQINKTLESFDTPGTFRLLECEQLLPEVKPQPLKDER